MPVHIFNFYPLRPERKPVRKAQQGRFFRAGLGEIVSPLKRDPKVLDAAEVVADQFVEPFALVALDGDRAFGHGAPPLFSAAGAVRFLRFSRPNVGGAEAPR